MYSPDRPDEAHLHPEDVRAFTVDYSQALDQASEEAGQTLVISESSWIYNASQLHKGDGSTAFPEDGVVYPNDSKTDTTTVAWFWAKGSTKSAEVTNKIRLNNKELSNKRIKIFFDR